MFQPVQIAAIAALNVHKSASRERAALQHRRDVLGEGLARVGWDIPQTEGRFRVGSHSRPFRAMGSIEFSSPPSRRAMVRFAGIGFGDYGRRLRALRTDRERATAPAKRCAASARPSAARFALPSRTLASADRSVDSPFTIWCRAA